MQIGDSKEWHAGVVIGVDNEKRTEDALYEVGTQFDVDMEAATKDGYVPMQCGATKEIIKEMSPNMPLTSTI